MGDPIRVAGLVQDVRDVLPVGSYGLYELIWTLSGEYPELTDTEKIADAVEALKRLTEAQEVRLVKLRWPSEEVVGSVAVGEISPSSFQNPTKDVPYVAMISAS